MFFCPKFSNIARNLMRANQICSFLKSSQTIDLIGYLVEMIILALNKLTHFERRNLIGQF